MGRRVYDMTNDVLVIPVNSTEGVIGKPGVLVLDGNTLKCWTAAGRWYTITLNPVPTPTATPTASPVPLVSPTATAAPTVTATATATATPVATATAIATGTPVSTPSPTPSFVLVGTFTVAVQADRINLPNHGLVDGNQIKFALQPGNSSAALPFPLSDVGNYFVVGSRGNDFQVSSVVGGSVINIIDSGVGSNQVWKKP